MTPPVFETPRLTLRYWDHPPSRDVSQTAERIRMSAEVDPR
jgi:hypothetical protein